MPLQKYSEEEIMVELLNFPEWHYKAGSLVRNFSCKSFEAAVLLFNNTAQVARNLNHHPDFFNSYRDCKISLRTHDIDGISALDFEFIRKLESDLIPMSTC
jgi:4a-hydroxytetrahydrobiopterin dehydratase